VTLRFMSPDGFANGVRHCLAVSNALGRVRSGRKLVAGGADPAPASAGQLQCKRPQRGSYNASRPQRGQLQCKPASARQLQCKPASARPLQRKRCFLKAWRQGPRSC